ncbi:hypothetical protein QE382_001598 [Sphingobacterium zeae]|uniref:Uncharacterized protein n=1 Tax=Sphingobacterium zeae TaxID=1776859 RepID=A0ABU0U3S7_9SPHI|nr:hypothetical protein [Sphingobacterium zeae]
MSSGKTFSKLNLDNLCVAHVMFYEVLRPLLK